MLVHFVWTWHLVGVDHEAVCRDRLGVGRGCQMLSNTCIPLTIAPKLRICIVCSKRFQDRQGVSSLEQVRPDNTDSCVSHNRRPKCHRKLPLELHFFTFRPS